MNKKILTAVIGVVVVAVLGGLVYYFQGGNLEGLMKFKFPQKTGCRMEFGNFDPNPGSKAKYGDAIDFQWNGPGCSKYKWRQYALCFKNADNVSEYACVGVPNSNHKTLSASDWQFIDGEMKTVGLKNQVDTYWFVQSTFVDSLTGEMKEILKTSPWTFSYRR